MVDVWSNSSRCRQESVYLLWMWCLYTWSCLDNVIIIWSSINCPIVICLPTVCYFCREKPLVKSTTPGLLFIIFSFAIYFCRNRPHLVILNSNDTYVSVPLLSLGLSTVRSNPSQSTSSHCEINRSSWPNKTQISEKKYEAIRDHAYKRSKKLK